MSQRDGVAVGGGLRAERGAEAALSAAAIVDDDLLIPGFREFDGEQARQRIGAAARRKRHNEAHGFFGKVGGDGRRGEPDGNE